MSRNCLLVISKNEGLNPVYIAEQVLETSDVVDKVIISDGSNKEDFQRLKRKESRDIKVISEKKFIKTEVRGKGVGMINGGIAAIKEGFDNIAFIDGDIYNPNLGSWFKFLFEPLERNIDVVKASFLRHPADAQITRHITKPLIAMFFPNAWVIDQPLGGELALKKEVLKDLLMNDIPPPYDWGIDTFITMKSLIRGYNIGEVYLGQKMHGKKTLTNLREMFIQCLNEAVKMIFYYQKLNEKQEVKNIVKISSPFSKKINFNENYMDIRSEVGRSLGHFKNLKKLEMPYDHLFYKMKNLSGYSEFYESTKPINVDIWVNTLYWFVKKYSYDLIEQFYMRWKIRALSFCLHNISTYEEAEKTTVEQARFASMFLRQIKREAAVEDKQGTI